MKRNYILFLCLLFLFQLNFAQIRKYDILIKGGHVIDAKNNINSVMDIAIKEGVIALIEKSIDIVDANQVVDAKGLYVTPGIIDIHTHNFYGNHPDQYLMDGNVAVVPVRCYNSSRCRELRMAYFSTF